MARPRVLVSTDLGGSDPDDVQSLFRLLHHSDLLEVDGLVSSPGPGQAMRADGSGLRPARPSADAIRHWIRYVELDALRGNGLPGLIGERAAIDRVRQGAMLPRAPGDDGATEGSAFLVERALADDDRPLWVLAWGCMTDVAQALHDEPRVADRIRIYGIASSNALADRASYDFVLAFMRHTNPGLWWIDNGAPGPVRRDTFRGVYQGGDQDGRWGNRAFVDEVIRPRVPVFPLAQGMLKEGDSPSVLYLLSPTLGGVGDLDDPTAPGWGGQFRRPEPGAFPNYFTDLDADAEACRATVSRWRREQLSAWEGRWSVYDATAS